MPDVVEMKQQFKETPVLYNEYVILDKEVPSDINLEKIKIINLLPLSLPSKLRLLERLRSEPAAGARELVTA